MQITCPKCTKIFEVQDSLIPDKGRLLQCGSCDNKWFFVNKEKKLIIKNNIKSENKISQIYIDDKEKDFYEDKELNVKNKEKTNFFKIIIVIIISFIGLIIIVDTFKFNIATIYPNINDILNSLYESLKDIHLFIKDLFN